MSHTRAHMETEWQESPDAIRRQRDALAAPLAELVRHLAPSRPQFVVTCARGSSAHAATFGKHLIERYLGIPVAAAAPSIATVYRQRLKLSGQLFLAMSQSGPSDDLVEAVAMAKAAGAVTAAIVNDTDSPLARACDIVLPMAAGPELSVAATKTFITSLTACCTSLPAGPSVDACRALSTGCPIGSRPPWSSTGARRCRRLRGDEPRDHRPRTDAGDRPRGRTEVQGDLATCMRRPSAAPNSCTVRSRWFEPLSDPAVHADRCRRRRAATARRGSARQGCQRVHDR